jgi:hypothetical protein
VKRLTIEGDWRESESSQYWDLFSGPGAPKVSIVAKYVTSVEDIPDPLLPTEEGTHIAATVTRGEVKVRTVLTLIDTGAQLAWRSLVPVAERLWHGPRHISDWRILDLDQGAP